MGPKQNAPQTDALFVNRLDELINLRHPLVRLGSLIDWSEIERTFAVSFTSGRGRPALPPRLVAGLLYLQHTFDASDEAVVNTWIENPYWQFFCGETYLQTEAPIDPSSLTRWRQRIGEAGVETLLAATIEAARRGNGDAGVRSCNPAKPSEPPRMARPLREGSRGQVLQSDKAEQTLSHAKPIANVRCSREPGFQWQMKGKQVGGVSAKNCNRY